MILQVKFMKISESNNLSEEVNHLLSGKFSGDICFIIEGITLKNWHKTWRKIKDPIGELINDQFANEIDLQVKKLTYENNTRQ